MPLCYLGSSRVFLAIMSLAWSGWCCHPVLGQPRAVRLPIPSEMSLAEATKMVAEVYKKEYDAAKAPLQKQALAKKLLSDAEKTPDDATARFALLNVSRKLAAQAGDVELAFLIADKQVGEFDLPETPLKASLLVEAGDQLRTPEQCYYYGRLADRLTPALRAAGLWKELHKIAECAEVAAGKLRDHEFGKVWSERQTEATALQKMQATYLPALASLETSPVDPQLNELAGRLKCFLHEDWTAGLPLLALAKDTTLQQLAESELRETSPAQRVAIAEGWSEYASKLDRYERAAVLRHAWSLFSRSAKDLDGLSKSRAKSKADAIFAEAMPARFPLALLTPSKTIVHSNDFQVLVGIVGGRKFPDTLWAHPVDDGQYSEIVYELPCDCKSLQGMFAFKDMKDDHPHNSDLFRVLGDNGRELWRAPMRWRTLGQAVPFKVDVRGQRSITLRVECDGFVGANHAIWVEPLLQR